MRLVKAILLIGGICLVPDKALGANDEKFLDKYKGEIQEYIMTGNEKGWKNCDILSAQTSTKKIGPKMSMGLNKIRTLNIKSTCAFSSCLLAYYHVVSMSNLTSLIDFGWAAIQHVRFALVVKLHSGITLDMITNTTKLPFLIAAELQHGREQFLCPTLGNTNPSLQQQMCELSHVSHRGKTLRIALLGIPPHFMLTSDGNIDGVNMRMLKILEQKLNFTSEITVPQSFLAAETQVCDIFHYSDRSHHK